MKIIFDSEQQKEFFIGMRCPSDFGYERQKCSDSNLSCKECLEKFIEMEVKTDVAEVSFNCSAEKAVFMLKASRMFDGGYKDFIDSKRVLERLEELRKETNEEYYNTSAHCFEHHYADGQGAGINLAINIVKEEVG